MTQWFFLKLWPEMRLGATVSSRRKQASSQWKTLILQKQRRSERFDKMLRLFWFVFFYANGIVHMDFVPLEQTVNQPILFEGVENITR